MGGDSGLPTSQAFHRITRYIRKIWSSPATLSAFFFELPQREPTPDKKIQRLGTTFGLPQASRAASITLRGIS